MYILLFILALLLYLWFLSYREGIDEGVEEGVTSTPADSTSFTSAPVGSAPVTPPVDPVASVTPPVDPVTPPTSVSTCDSINAQNKFDMDALNEKLNRALNLSTTIQKMEMTLQQNATKIDTIINTQLTALINGRR